MENDKSIETLIDHEVTKAGGAKEDGYILLSSRENLNSHLACAPYAISVLSTVNLFAAEGRDFELVEGEDISRFKNLKFPNSFRATISDVSNKACNAFFLADSSMHRIWLIMRQVPKHVQGALEVMDEGTPAEVADFLPVHLKYLRADADKCKLEATLVLDSFQEVSSILDDLIVAMTLAKGKKEGSVENALKKIEEWKQEEKRIQEDKQKVEKAQENTYRELQRRKAQLDTELEYQGSWKQVAKEGVASLLDVPGKLVDLIASPFKSQTPQVRLGF